MKIKFLIIDDDPSAVNVIKNYLQQIGNSELTISFNNAVDGWNFMKNNPVDVIFLDINMSALDRLDFVKNLKDPSSVIITSAYFEFASESFDLNVLDYLVKPFELPRFMRAINKVYERLEINKNGLNAYKKRAYLFIKIDKKKMKKVFFDEILVIESLKDYLKVNTTNGKFIIHSTLTDFTNLLPVEDFIRIHRSYTISVNKIDTIEGNSLKIDGIRYAIGRSYLKKVKEMFFSTSI